MTGKPDRITFWLWYGSQIVASVRADRCTDNDTVRCLALSWHQRVLLVDQGEAPFERAAKILRSEIKVYPGGN